MVSEEKIFSCLPYILLYKTCDPRAGPFFYPSGIIFTNLVEVHLLMLIIKYQGSGPRGFRQEDFFHISLNKPMKNMSPPGRGHFWPHVYNLNNLGRRLLGDAKYQISIV